MNPGKKDIEDRKDVQTLIDAFYGKMRVDDTIGYIFNEVARVDWVHRLLNQQIPLKREHFERWKKLFLETIGEHFEGEKAELARQRAVSIATMIQIKIQGGAV